MDSGFGNSHCDGTFRAHHSFKFTFPWPFFSLLPLLAFCTWSGKGVFAVWALEKLHGSNACPRHFHSCTIRPTTWCSPFLFLDDADGAPLHMSLFRCDITHLCCKFQMTNLAGMLNHVVNMCTGNGEAYQGCLHYGIPNTAAAICNLWWKHEKVLCMKKFL